MLRGFDDELAECREVRTLVEAVTTWARPPDSWCGGRAGWQRLPSELATRIGIRALKFKGLGQAPADGREALLPSSRPYDRWPGQSPDPHFGIRSDLEFTLITGDPAPIGGLHLRSAHREGGLPRDVIHDRHTGAHVRYTRGFLCPQRCRELMATLTEYRPAFTVGTIMIGERTSRTPRMVAAFGDDAYRYVGMSDSLPWFPELAAARDLVVATLGHPINYALVNWYRDGHDHTGWHSDKMDMHLAGTGVAILSLGATRSFLFRRAARPASIVGLEAEAGSLIWMGGSTQTHYEHSVPACPSTTEPRLSVTFRCVRTGT